MLIFLIRHGETPGNARRIVQLPGIPLSPRGVAQAERLARRLGREGIARILSSDLARAAMTAEHLRQVTGAPVQFDPLLQERNFGDLRGTAYADLRSRILSSDLARAAMTAEHLRQVTGAPVQFDPLLQERNFGDLRGTAYADLGFDMFAPGYAPPNGETWEVFHARVDRAWALVQESAAATSGHLAVVTHGLVCRSLASRHLILPAGQDVPERWENSALTVIEGPAPW